MNKENRKIGRRFEDHAPFCPAGSLHDSYFHNAQIRLAPGTKLCLHAGPPMKFLACFLALLAGSSVLRADEYEARSFTAPDGSMLPYRLLQPKEHKTKVPLVLFLHGSGTIMWISFGTAPPFS
jgi:hypothetical protein